MKVAVLTMYGNEHKELAEISLPNMIKYCERWGYDGSVITVENHKWEYKKHEMFQELFKRDYDVIWYRDIDLLITNLSIPITWFIDTERSFYLTMDFNELNGGSVIIKNTAEGREFNQDILYNRNIFENEQNYFNDQINLDTFANTIRILEHPSINSYDYSTYPECKDLVGEEKFGDWKEGNFVIHFPAHSLEKRLELMKEYSQKVIE